MTQVVEGTSMTGTSRNPVLVALMLCMGLVAIDSTIVATAVPKIVEALGGFAQFPWLFSVYLLTQAVTVPLYGKFADAIGRKPVLFFGIGLFLAGSMLCGTAWSMTTLIAFRALQGVGAGAVMPITTTIVGDLYSVAERGRVQGYMSSVWGISAVVGPALGGFFTQYLTWRWIFFVNLPVGAGAVFMLTTYFREHLQNRRRHRIDVAGTLSLTAGCTLLILGLLEGGVGWAWGSAQSVGVFVAGAALVAVFIAVERRAAEPVLPLWVFSRRVLVAGNLAALAVGALTLGLSSYVPTYAQGVLGAGAVLSGFTLAAMSVGWPLASSFTGRIYTRIGFRDNALLGSVFCVVGTVLFALLPQSGGLWRIALSSFVVGLGLGFASTAVIVAVQSVVGWERRGVVTGANMFCRSIGSAVGVAIFGAIANSVLAHHMHTAPAAIRGQFPPTVDATAIIFGGTSHLTVAARAFLRHALYDGAHHIFVALVVVAAMGAVFEAVMPRRTAVLGS